MGEQEMTLRECPPGLFLFNGTLCFKSEYTTTLENPRRYQPDAYVVSSGEYFWGGAKTAEERSKLMVEPLTDLAARESAAERRGIERAAARVRKFEADHWGVTEGVRSDTEQAVRALQPLATSALDDAMERARAEEREAILALVQDASEGDFVTGRLDAAIRARAQEGRGDGADEGGA